ncbi:DNA polymerase iota [Fundulus heteroclitus]|uniref:DNA polymerase iota n=1 Tax=Fundulus heteroclitus TaxID=8078 RepID=UPI00165C3851|nr:DNA polymerase iota [Fundulus heteroclitus]
MDNSDGEMEEDESEWKACFVDSAAVCPSTSVAATSGSIIKTPESVHRVILHFDLDCFYAQVEMIRNPALRDVPLGIQQKYIIVTCNYMARERGVTKLMSVTDAKEKCPELVLVKGEDLTHYREMSYKVTEVLMSYCPLVERLGFDENFVDVTEMVEQRLARTSEPNSFSFKGHVFNHLSADTKASRHPRLAMGSHIAAELREAIHSKLGLTGCAGVATNKLLAKLVSGTFKPNQQTVLLQENIGDIMGCLSGLRKVPGVGHQTARRLQALGLVSVKDLQVYPLSDLSREFGGPTAQRLKNLALGIDDSAVTPTGAPQSLSDEDSFKKMCSVKEVVEKIQELLSSLVGRMHTDGRQPQTFRLTIRRYSATNKWFSRESRQCPIPGSVGQKIISGSPEDAASLLVPLAMKLFHKMVECGAAFHLTLINVCFSNLQSRGPAVSGKGAITSFFTQSASPRKSQISSSQNRDSSTQNADGCLLGRQVSACSRIAPPKSRVTSKGACSSEEPLHGSKWEQSCVCAVEENHDEASCSTERIDLDESRAPPNVDPEVFKLLPEEIRKELLSPAYSKSPPGQSASGAPRMSENELWENDSAAKASVKRRRSAGINAIDGGDVTEQEELSPPRSSDCDFPGNVDPEVFSELPPDVQKELLLEWRQQKPVLKAPSSRKPGKGSAAKGRDRKAEGRSGQSNNLFKYFKPA